MSYSVRIEPSAHIFQVEPGETVLDAALRQGVALPYGCRNGSCGSCKGKLLEGLVSYPQGVPEGLSASEQQEGYQLFCKAVADSDLVIQTREVGAVKDIQVKILPTRVMEKTQLNHDVMLVKLVLPKTERLQFLAGQYIDFLLKDGKRRSFSLANAPHDDAMLELHIRLIPDGRFTHEVFDTMQTKDLLRIEGPLGSFFLREESSRPIIFMAGGTGFAPIKGMIEHALKIGIQRPMHLYWGVRSREDLYMDELARSWTQQNPLIRYTPVLSEPKPEDQWQGHTGFVHEAIVADYPELATYEIYASGPPAMVYAGRDEFVKHGLDLEHYFSDAFEFQTETVKTKTNA